MEQDLEAIKTTEELVTGELDTVLQAATTAHNQIMAARQMIEKANTILAMAEPVYSANLKRQTELTDMSISLVRDETAKASELEEARARLTSTLALAEDDLRKQALTTVEEEQRRELSILELKLRSYVNR